MIRRACSARQRFTKRCTVRRCFEAKRSGAISWRRVNTVGAESAGSARSQASIRSHSGSSIDGRLGTRLRPAVGAAVDRPLLAPARYGQGSLGSGKMSCAVGDGGSGIAAATIDAAPELRLCGADVEKQGHRVGPRQKVAKRCLIRFADLPARERARRDVSAVRPAPRSATRTAGGRWWQG
jgi:hypothetical protein